MISNAGWYCSINREVFSFSNNGKTRSTATSAVSETSRATKYTIKSILKLNTHKKGYLSLYCALTIPHLIKQAFVYD